MPMPSSEDSPSSSPKRKGEREEEDSPSSQADKCLFGRLDEGRQLALEFEDVRAYVEPKFGPDASATRWSTNPFRKREAKLKQILHGVSGTVAPGNVVALMGPSGSGKSTLLETLGGRSNRSIKVKGSILFNGMKMNKSVKRRLAFVSQDDLLHQNLTVEEALSFIALLRLPKSWSKTKKIERVDRVIEKLRLRNCRHTMIGNGNSQRGVSGGERKRTSVGCELLTDPSLLLLDEPTSGLDSTIALQLVQILRELASDGRSIIASIHQPSSRLFFMFDHVLLLSQGHVIYKGRTSACHVYFDVLGFPVPAGISTADHILDLSSAEVSDATRTGIDVLKYLIDTSARYERMTESDLGFDVTDSEVLLRAKLEEGDSREMSSKMFSQASMFRRYSSLTGKSASEEDRISWLAQVGILTLRSIKTRRHDVVTLQDFLQFAVISLLAGMFWWDIGGSGSAIQAVSATEIAGLLFFVMYGLDSCTDDRSPRTDILTRASHSPGLQDVHQLPHLIYEPPHLPLGDEIVRTGLAFDRSPSTLSLVLRARLPASLVKERKSAMYSLSAFFVARSGSDIPSDLALPTMLVTIVYWMSGLNSDVGVFFSTIAVYLLILLVSSSIGLLIGALVQSVKTAQALAATLMLTFILVGGYFVSVDST